MVTRNSTTSRNEGWNSTTIICLYAFKSTPLDEEKKLKPTEHHMVLRNGDVHTPEYLKLNPKGVATTLIDRGVAIVELTVICEYLDEAYPSILCGRRILSRELKCALGLPCQMPDYIMRAEP